MKRHNLHTHTTYSDGEYSPEELVRKAMGVGLEIIGISDHGFTRKTYCIDKKNLPEYIAYLKSLKEKTSGIELKIGLEIDVSESFGINPENLPFDILNNLDYVLFEYVEGIDNIEGGDGRCLRAVIQVRRKLLIPVGLAHTNFHNFFYKREGEAAQLIGENNIFVELNTRYIPTIEHFFSRDLIECFKKHEVKFTIGTDNHYDKPDDNLDMKIDQAMKYILERGLKVHEIVC